MQAEDNKRFAEVVTAMATLYGATMEGPQIKLWFKLLESVDISVFENVAMEYMQSDSAFMPKPGQLLALIRKQDGRPTPEEAWNLVSFDEADTNVWTDEMAKAFWAAFDSGSDGDRIGARMAFLEVYKREVTQARNDGKPVHWSASFGTDVAGRLVAITNAMNRGAVLLEQAKNMLPSLTTEEISTGTLLPNNAAIVKLIGHG